MMDFDHQVGEMLLVFMFFAIVIALAFAVTLTRGD